LRKSGFREVKKVLVFGFLRLVLVGEDLFKNAFIYCENGFRGDFEGGAKPPFFLPLVKGLDRI